LRGGGFPAPYSSPLVPPLTDGQQRRTLFSCQSAFPASLSRSVTDGPRNSKNVLRVARRVPQMSTGFPLSGAVLRLEPSPFPRPCRALRRTLDGVEVDWTPECFWLNACHGFEPANDRVTPPWGHLGQSWADTRRSLPSARARKPARATRSGDRVALHTPFNGHCYRRRRVRCCSVRS
jgi:hypothetical protein